MLKKIGLLGLLLAGTGVLLPSFALAEEHYYPSRDKYQHSDREGIRREARDNKDFRQDEWRRNENKRREHENRRDRYENGTDRHASFDFRDRH
jgi:hypothetical protein